MGKSVFDILAPVAGAVLGTVLLPGLGTALGASISGMAGGAIGSGIGAGLNTGIKTGNPLAGLASGVASGAGSYVGGQFLGPALEGTGAGTSAMSGGATPGFAGTSIAKSLGDAGLSGAESVFGSQTPGSMVGSSVGSSLGESGAQTALPGLYKQNTPDPTPWSPTRQSAMDLPSSLSGYQNLDPLQQATNIASRGVYGGGAGSQETNYFLNLINRNLVGDNGKAASDLSSINPVEHSFLSQIGLGGYNNPNDLLKGMSQYQYS